MRESKRDLNWQVCGKFFAGRGRLTPAYTHSVSLGHFVFMNLRDGRAYCLPDGYEVRDSSLRDVQFCLSPVFTFREVGRLNYNTSLARGMYVFSSTEIQFVLYISVTFFYPI